MKEEYQKIKRHYDNIHLQYAEKGGVVMTDIINAFLEKIEKNELIADLGCGPGHDVNYMTQKGYQAIGIDFSPKMIEYAKKNNLGSFYCLNICDENTFNKLKNVSHFWISAMLMHLSSADQIILLKKINHIIKDGVLGLIVPENVKKREIIFNNYTKTKLKNLMKATGFKIIHFSNFEFNQLKWHFIMAKKEK